MTTPHPPTEGPQPASATSAARRELLGLVLLLLGALGGLGLLATVDWRWAVGAVCLGVTALGAYLTMSKE